MGGSLVLRGRRWKPLVLRGVSSSAEQPGTRDDAGAAPASVTVAALDAIPADVAILDDRGQVLITNQAWRRSEEQSTPGSRDLTQFLAGECTAQAPSAERVIAHGLRGVLQGEQTKFHVEYPSTRGATLRWFLLTATSFREGAERRTLVHREEITDWKRSERALQEATAHLLVAQDTERRRIAREIHDGTVPSLVGLSLDLARLVPRLSRRLRPIGESCSELCEQSLVELRTMSFLLHPPMLERNGLVASIRRLVDGFMRRSGIAVSFNASEDGAADTLGVGETLALYRIAQEALVNIHRHTSSRTARVALRLAPGEARLTVSDEGGGADASEWSAGDSTGLGIAGMRERLRALGGRLEIRTDGSSTSVEAIIPRPA
jgi:two-component system NarL family sensor kinase